MALPQLQEFFSAPLFPRSLGPEETAFVLDPCGSFCTLLHPDSGEACRVRTFGLWTYPFRLQGAQADYFAVKRVGRFVVRLPYFSSDYVRRAGPFYLLVFTDASCAISYFPEMGSYVTTALEARQAARALGLEFLLTRP